MDGFRFRSLMFITFALGLGMPQVSWTQTTAPGVAKTAGKVTLPGEMIYKFYSLADLEGENLGYFIADSIRSVIQPETWIETTFPSTAPGPSIRCSPNISIMVVRHTPEVHAEIDVFLQRLRMTIAMKNNGSPSRKPVPVAAIKPARTVSDPNVAQAGFSTAKANDADAANKPNAYLIPTADKQPKHLFHMILRFEGNGMESAVSDLVKKLVPDSTATSDQAKSETAKVEPINQLLHFIIRYEGEGLIDATVVEFMKYLPKQATEGSNGTPPSAKTVPTTDWAPGPASFPSNSVPPASSLPPTQSYNPELGDEGVQQVAAHDSSLTSAMPTVLRIIQRLRLLSELAAEPMGFDDNR